MFHLHIHLPNLADARAAGHKGAKISGAMTTEEFDLSDAGAKTIKVASTFRVQNLDTDPNSLKPEVLFSGWENARSPIRFTLTIKDPEALHLPPFEPKDVEAVNEAAPATYVFSWFQTYTLRPTVGREQKIRVWNASKIPVSWFKFYVFLFFFRFCGWPWKRSRIVV